MRGAITWPVLVRRKPTGLPSLTELCPGRPPCEVLPGVLWDRSLWIYQWKLLMAGLEA